METPEHNNAEQPKLRITPNAALIAASIIALSASFISVWIAMHQPWMGVSLAVSENGLEVVEVADDGPSANILSAGDVIVTIAGQAGNAIHLQSRDITEDPDAIPTFAERNVFRERQTLLYNILQQPVAVLTLEDGRVVRIQPQEKRPAADLPFSFLVLSLYSITALLVGSAIWGVKQQSVPTRYLLLSGFGAVCLLNAVNIIVSRELALDGSFYQLLTFFYHFGNNLFSLGMIGLIWNYPRPLGRFPIVPALVVYMLFFMLNENLEWTELPGNSVLIQVPLYIFSGIAIMIAQWIRSRHRPVDRAIVKMLTLMVWVIILALSGSYFTSALLLELPGLTLAGSFFGMFTIYIALSLAVIRFRFFDIDRWWIEVWLWFFAGVAIIAFDLALATFANMAPSYALGIAVITVAWLYFPVRQWVWAKLFRRRPHNLEEYVPLLLSHFVREDYADSMQFWKKVLNDVFRPLAIEARQEAVPNAMILDGGLRLRMPCLVPECSVELEHADNGARLFNSDDVKLAQALFNISERASWQREVYMQGILDERKRIMRDLHDDIGGRLLTMTHTEHGEARTAVEALKRLREIIYSLDAEQQVTVNAAIARLRIESLERCEMAKVIFEWRWQELAQDIALTPRQFLNLTLICREGLTNALKHAQAKRVVFDLHANEGKLGVKIENDGLETGPNSGEPGAGLRNMRNRVEELGGKFDYACGDETFCVKFSIPLDESAGAYDA